MHPIQTTLKQMELVISSSRQDVDRQVKLKERIIRLNVQRQVEFEQFKAEREKKNGKSS